MIIQIKHSGNTGNVPLVLANGELALNYADQKLFYRHANGSILTLVDAANTPASIDQFARDTANGAYSTANAAFDKANGSAQNAFSSILVASQNTINAISNSSSLEIIAGESITLNTDSINSSITISVTTLNGGTF